MTEQEILDQKMDSISELGDEAFLNAPDSLFTLDETNDENSNDDSQTDHTSTVENEDEENEETEDETLDNQEVENEDGSEGEGSENEENNEEENTNSSDDDSLLYKETHDKIFKPFKANGRDIQVKDVDEAIRLMQMGVGFHSKMTELKPAMGIIRTLEQNGLLDEDKIKLFIDLNNKNPEAVRHFLKQNEIDPLDIDMDDETKYESKVNI